MKKLTPYEVARAFYLAAKPGGDREAKSAAKRLAALLKERGDTLLLARVLEELPAAMRDVDAEERVTVESARELDAATVREVLEAAGIGPDREVATRVMPELLGGFRVRTKDGIIDASVRRKVDTIRRSARTTT